jgi:hypothetical protein
MATLLKSSINCHVAKIIGSLLYLTGHSRPEVHQYASYTLKPVTEHGNVLKCIGHYLKNTQHKQIKKFVLENNKKDGDVKDDNKAVDPVSVENIHEKQYRDSNNSCFCSLALLWHELHAQCSLQVAHGARMCNSFGD